MAKIVVVCLLAAVLCYAIPLDGRGYGAGYESYSNYAHGRWIGGSALHKPLGFGRKYLKALRWHGNYGGYGAYGGGPGYGGYVHPVGPGFGGPGNSVSTASASASSNSGGLFGGGSSSSQAHSETATFNLGPLSATFSRSNANSASVGK